MREIIKWNEKQLFLFTNHQVKQLENKEYTWKILYEHIKAYQEIIYSLLEENEQLLNNRKI